MSAWHRRWQSGVFVERYGGGCAMGPADCNLCFNFSQLTRPNYEYEYAEDADMECSMAQRQDVLHGHGARARVQLLWLMGGARAGGLH